VQIPGVTSFLTLHARLTFYEIIALKLAVHYSGAQVDL
jgi:hypothetical protein